MVDKAVEAIDNDYKVTVNAKILTKEEAEELTTKEIRQYEIYIDESNKNVRLYK